ncbi:MAG: hypothetical protein J4A00_00305 [Gammaproteobacteria bacterium]|nr:hypothetical protein [Gammaproteobacteria bacterium]
MLFAYDRDEDGALDSGDRLGFRYNGTDRVVEMRSSGSVLTSCDDGTWANINDERTIVIENFDVVEWVYSVGSADERRLQITLDGAVNLRGNPTDISSGDPLEIVRRSYTESVRVRNDEL